MPPPIRPRQNFNPKQPGAARPAAAVTRRQTAENSCHCLLEAHTRASRQQNGGASATAYLRLKIELLVQNRSAHQQVPDSRSTTFGCRATPIVSHCLDPGLLETAPHGPCLFRTPLDLQTAETGAGKQKTWDERPGKQSTHREVKLFANQKIQKAFFVFWVSVPGVQRVGETVHFGKKVPRSVLPLSMLLDGTSGPSGETVRSSSFHSEVPSPAGEISAIWGLSVPASRLRAFLAGGCRL